MEIYSQHKVQESTVHGPSKSEEKVVAQPPMEVKDQALASNVDKTETPKQEMQIEEAPAIVQTGTQLKDVQLNNLDSWSKVDWNETASEQSQVKKDETWSQMQKKRCS